MADVFKFELVSPERLVLKEEVASVVVPGAQGDFTVLKDHAPFMTTIRPGVIEVTAVNGKAHRVFVRGGFADVSPAGLTVLADKAIAVEDLTADNAAAEVRLAEAELAAAKSDEAKAAAGLKLADIQVAVTAGAAKTATAH